MVLDLSGIFVNAVISQDRPQRSPVKFNHPFCPLLNQQIQQLVVLLARPIRGFFPQRSHWIQFLQLSGSTANQARDVVGPLVTSKQNGNGRRPAAHLGNFRHATHTTRELEKKRGRRPPDVGRVVGTSLRFTSSAAGGAGRRWQWRGRGSRG
uniref:Uncharacterized protein n=1 Tax=Opuntia streptacantha TaxID=393608 RepID=A0A7C9EPL2_OPUST